MEARALGASPLLASGLSLSARGTWSQNAWLKGATRAPDDLVLLDTLCSGAFNLDIKGMPKLKSYYNDLFHTLVNVRVQVPPALSLLVVSCHEYG